MALALLETILPFYPGMAALNIQRGALLCALRRFPEALAAFDAVLAIDPFQADAHFGRGAVLHAQGKPGEALIHYDRALEIQPSLATALNDRGLALRQTGDLAGALESYDAAIALMPDCADFRFGKAMCLLQLGRHQEGWRLYEWRKARILAVAPPPPGALPWRGENPAGKTLLIQAEQGLGDTIQFCRYAALPGAQGARVVLQVQERLTRLIQTLPFPVTVIGEEAPPPACDYHVMLMSLPSRYDTIPSSVPYLAAEPARIAAWRRKIGAGGLKIGISWQGERKWAGKEKSWDIGRSFPLSLFEAIAAIPNVRLISLQKNDGVEQLNSLPPGMKVESLGDDFDSGPQAFLDTAAVMQSLDLVITADTAVAHLAGALCRPVWLALRHAPDWRWLLAREDSPWYPTMHLFRQTVPGDWRGPFDRMAAALRSGTWNPADLA